MGLFHWNGMKRAYWFYNQTDWSSNPGCVLLSMWTWTGYLTYLTLSFLIIIPTLQRMMRKQWDNMCNAPTTVPSMYFVLNKCSFSASLYIHREAAHWVHETWTPNLYRPLPNPPLNAQGCSDIQIRMCLSETLQSITPGLTILSISEHAYFLISFFLSGFTFISSNCYSLFSRREFMLTSSIHLPTSPVTSHQDNELIFLKECLLFLVNKLPWASLWGPTNPSFKNLLDMYLKNRLFISVSTVLFSSLILAFPYQFGFVS